MADEPEPGKCDFCRHRIPEAPVTASHEGRTYECCSRACRDALTEGEYVFSEYHAARRVSTGVAGLDPKLPQGMPRNSLVLLSGMAGTRTGALTAELLWRALRRDEPAIAVTFTEPPGALVQRFLELDWNVLPYLERGDLRILDCFTYRVEDRERLYDRMNRWNSHLHGAAEAATTTVRDASDLSSVLNNLDNCLEDAGMTDRGVVAVDSLTELGSLVQPVQAYDFVKDLRAHVCKGRYVPVFAGATYGGDSGEFPHDLVYVADGVVDLELNGDIVQDTLLKRVRIRKMSDALSYAEWTAYEYTAGLGMVTYDPREQEGVDGGGPPGEDGPAETGDGDDPDGPEAGDGPDAAAAEDPAAAAGEGDSGATADDGESGGG